MDMHLILLQQAESGTTFFGQLQEGAENAGDETAATSALPYPRRTAFQGCKAPEVEVRLRRTWWLAPLLMIVLLAPSAEAATPQWSSHLAAAIAHYSKSRSDSISVGVWDETTGQTFFWRPLAHYDSASIVKVDILETVLWRAQRQHRWLSAWEQQQAVPMISR
ncbi:MAG: hypothetical protein JOZ82_11860, partial [Marmoricola sp.]|nr:hypothetical protein [Marmoricola sp.]